MTLPVWDLWNQAFPALLSFADFFVIVLRLVFAAFLGGLIGLQRERQHKSAGLRTHMLVALGSALFVLVPLRTGMEAPDLSRVIQGVATGIGFLGGGAILKLSDNKQIRGLTTAATIWLTAGLGIAVAMGQILMALVIVALAWGILSVLGRMERGMLSKKRSQTSLPP